MIVSNRGHIDFFEWGREMISSWLTATSSAPCLSSFFADSLVISRVIARTAQSFLSLGSFRKILATEPPWLPVEPSTAIILLADMITENTFGEIDVVEGIFIA